jgi:hypothetical protein
MRSQVIALLLCLFFLFNAEALVWGETSVIDPRTLSQSETIRILDSRNADRDFRIALRGGPAAALYAEGLTLIRHGQIELGLSKLEEGIEKAIEMSLRDPLTFNDLTHRYGQIAFSRMGFQRPGNFFRQLANNHPNIPLVQATFAFNTLRNEGVHTIGRGLRSIDKAFQIDPGNLFARVAKALTLSYLPFGFAAADREWQRLLDDSTVPPDFMNMLLTFRRQTYLLHGHRERAAALPAGVRRGGLAATLTSMLTEQSLDDHQQFLELQSRHEKTEALNHIERVLGREVDQPAFPLLFGQYMVALERENERGARFFEQLAIDHPSSPHALAAFGFYTHVARGGQIRRRGLEMIEELQKQAGPQHETRFLLGLAHAMLAETIPGKLDEALHEFEDLVATYRAEVPYAPWVVRGHMNFVREVHGLQPNTFWSTYDPWKDYVEEQDERFQQCDPWAVWFL